MFEVFVVGGAVRDTLLGLSVKDLDHVVVGATAEDMLERGFSQVGADFPVFLHPDTGDEWALARTERKSGHGYHGFDVDFNPNVTLEDDLFRRDLTINAMAVRLEDWETFCKTKDWSLVVDPWNGLEDLSERVLRHVSEAFGDDPVRILRVARFAARLWNTFFFHVDQNTMELMRKMVENGEVDHLVPERVWAEFEKALAEDGINMFFHVLEGCRALERIAPLFVTTFKFVEKPIDSATKRNLSVKERMMLLCSISDADAVEKQLQDIKAPNDITFDCVFFNRLFNGCVEINSNPSWPSTEDMYRLLNRINGWKNVDRIKNMGVVMSMFSDKGLDTVFNILVNVLNRGSIASFALLTNEQRKTLKGKEIHAAIENLRHALVFNEEFVEV